MLTREDVAEREWQQLFVEFPDVLSESLPLRLSPTQIVPGGRPGKSEADFLIYPDRSEPGDLVYGAIELKRTDTPILTVPRRQVLRLSSDAQTAFAQARMYADSLRASLRDLTLPILAVGSHAHIFLIVGMSRELQHKVTTAHLREQFDGLLPPGTQLLPYDTLFERFSSRVPPQLHVAIDIRRMQSQAIILCDSEDGDTGHVLAALFRRRGVTAQVHRIDLSPATLSKAWRSDIVLLLSTRGRYRYHPEWIQAIVRATSQLESPNFYLVERHDDNFGDRVVMSNPILSAWKGADRYPGHIFLEDFGADSLAELLQYFSQNHLGQRRLTSR